MERHPNRWNLLARGADCLQGPCLAGIVFVLFAGMVLSVMESKSPQPNEPKSQQQNEKDFDARVRTLMLSEDGQYLDAVQGNSVWIRRDAHTGAPLSQQHLPAAHVFSARISRKGNLIAAMNAVSDLEILRDAASIWRGDLPERQPAERLSNCAVAPSGRLIAVASDRGSLWLLTVDQGQVASIERQELNFGVNQLEFSPDSDRLALAGLDGGFAIWDVSQQEMDARSTSFNVAGRSAAWSGDGRRLITFGHENWIRVWDARSAELLREWQARSQMVSVARLSYDGRLAAVSHDRSISVYDADTGWEVCVLNGHADVITDMYFADDRLSLFSSDGRGGLRRWSLTDQRVVWSVP